MSGRLRISIPDYQTVNIGKQYIAFNVNVIQNGKIDVVPKRYSQFLDLYKRLQKYTNMKFNFPSKLVLSKDEKFLERRRLGLEQYLQVVLEEFSGEVPLPLLDFVGKQYEDIVDSRFDNSVIADSSQSARYHRQPMICYQEDRALREVLEDPASLESDIIISGTLSALYGM